MFLYIRTGNWITLATWCLRSETGGSTDDSSQNTFRATPLASSSSECSLATSSTTSLINSWRDWVVFRVRCPSSLRSCLCARLLPFSKLLPCGIDWGRWAGGKWGEGGMGEEGRGGWSASLLRRRGRKCLSVMNNPFCTVWCVLISEVSWSQKKVE